MNLTELLDQTTASLPQKPALIEDEKIVSYGELTQKIAATAVRLEQLALTPGTRLGLLFPNSIDYIVLTFALWRIKAVVVPLPAECASDELSEMASSMQLQGVISHKSLGAMIQNLRAETETRIPSTEVAEFFFTRLAPQTPPDNHGLNIAFIRFTSGTTSARKGVVLCHETIRDRVKAANKFLRITSDDTIIWCLPMAHHFLITIVLYLTKGATVVLLRNTVLASSFLETVQRHRGTVLYAAPFHYSLLARDSSELYLTSIRLAVSTTCGLPADVAENFFKRFGQPLVQALGVIELGLVSMNTDDPRGRPGSVGRPAGDLRVRIVAPDGEGCGEVAVFGPGIFDAYAAPWLSREKVLRDGWFHTGDIGRIDADGYLFLLGRKTAVINLAGRKVFPEEIEAVLNRHPDVRESRVYGRAHAHLGEVVEADLVLAETVADLDSIRAFCRANLAAYKIPVRLNVVSSLPRTPTTGKIRRALAVA